MTIRRNRPSRLNTAGDVASEHAEVWRKLKRGKLDPALASRMSAILVNHRTIIETVKAEERIQELERTVEQLKQAAQEARYAAGRVMTTNVHKRLDKLQKEITEISAKGRAFHYIVGNANESAEAKLERMKSEGKIQAGDEYQMLDVPWVISLLKGSSHIPEGNPADPYAEPSLPPPPQDTTEWGDERERERRWKEHVRKIEASGERYDDDKPKGGRRL